eukprot:s25_g53.t2
MLCCFCFVLPLIRAFFGRFTADILEALQEGQLTAERLTDLDHRLATALVRTFGYCSFILDIQVPLSVMARDENLSVIALLGEAMTISLEPDPIGPPEDVEVVICEPAQPTQPDREETCVLRVIDWQPLTPGSQFWHGVPLTAMERDGMADMEAGPDADTLPADLAPPLPATRKGSRRSPRRENWTVWSQLMGRNFQLMGRNFQLQDSLAKEKE